MSSNKPVPVVDKICKTCGYVEIYSLGYETCHRCLSNTLVEYPEMKEKEPVPPNDIVNHPPHYTQGGVECIDALKAALGNDGFKAFLRGNVVKYLWRMEHKGKTLEDANKALWYLERLIEELANDHPN